MISLFRQSMFALVATLMLASCGSEILPQDMNLILISMDTVRRDHLPFYGYHRDTAPALSKLVEKSVVFDGAITQDTNTVPSHTSMFTGLYPHTHRSQINASRLKANRVPLASMLKDAGFRTAAFISGFTLERQQCGLDRGFDVYRDKDIFRKREGKISTDRAIEWIQEDSDSRYFVFLHLYDAHGPYHVESGYPNQFISQVDGPTLRVPGYQRLGLADGSLALHLGSYVDAYDSMIHYVDLQILRLLEAVDLEKTIILITADHGEALGERYHALDHGGQAFDEQIRIPLVIYAPGYVSRRVAQPVETVDYLPTVLELLDIPTPEGLGLQGYSLVPLLRGEAPEWRKLTFGTARAVSERHFDRGYQLDDRRRIRTARSDRWKLIHYPGLQRDYVELFDLEKDPGEKKNVAESHGDIVSAYLQSLDDWAADAPAEERSDNISAERLEQLKAMGYIDE